MREIKKAYKISEETWKISPEEKFYNADQKRAAKVVTIGYSVDNNGKEHPITENIYSDILPNILNKKYTAHLDLFASPHLVIEKDGNLIKHNLEIMIAEKKIIKVLDEVHVYNQIRALTELRINKYSSAGMGDAIRTVRAMLKMASGENYHFMLIEHVLKKQIFNQESEKVLEIEVSSYSKIKLLEAYGGVLEYKQLSVCKHEPIKNLLQENDINDIEAVLNKEISKRFFNGEIR